MTTKMKKFFAGVLLSMRLITPTSAQTISPYLFGQNAWMPDMIGTINYGGKLHENWKKVKDSKASIVRFGGIAPDNNKPTNSQYIKMIDSIKVNGMEPMMQVPYHNGAYTAQDAASIVQYVNITMGKGVKYWIIGNEPNLDYGFTTASQIAAYIKPFASAMKAIDPSIKIIGPETAWFDKGIIDGLTLPNGPYDITGKDGAGRYYVDIISFHFYGFNGTQTRDQVVSKLESANSLADNLVYLNNRLLACNSTHNRSGESVLKTAVTEANVGYRNASTDNLYGQGANSFVGGQFIAEMLGVGAKNNVLAMNIWSVIEGNNTELNIGYLDRTTGAKKPSYHHFQLVAENLKGTYITSTDNKSDVKIISSKDNQFIQVFVLNQNINQNYSYAIRLNNDVISGNPSLKVNVQANVNKEFSGVINNQTTLLLTFNLNGELLKKTEYSVINAASNQDPVVTTYNGSVVNNGLTTGENELASDFLSMKDFKINSYPNPNKSKFTIELDRNNSQEIKFVIEVYDLIGKLIYKNKSVFPDRKQIVDLTGSNLAEAVYIVRVREEGDEDNFKTAKMICFK
jgi:hypothetical protein